MAGRELFQINHIERYIKMKIQRARPPTIDEVAEARDNAFLDKLRSTLQAGNFRRQDRLVEVLLEEGFSSTDIVSALLHHVQRGDGAPPPAPPRALPASMNRASNRNIRPSANEPVLPVKPRRGG